MARIAGINIPVNKHTVVALTSIYADQPHLCRSPSKLVTKQGTNLRLFLSCIVSVSDGRPNLKIDC